MEKSTAQRPVGGAPAAPPQRHTLRTPRGKCPVLSSPTLPAGQRDEARPPRALELPRFDRHLSAWDLPGALMGKRDTHWEAVGANAPPGNRSIRAPVLCHRPVRTVPFFNLYDDIQITQLGGGQRQISARHASSLTGFMPESSRTPRSDLGSPEEVGWLCPATISSAPLGTPQVTPNDTSAPESGPFGRPSTPRDGIVRLT